MNLPENKIRTMSAKINEVNSCDNKKKRLDGEDCWSKHLVLLVFIL